MLGLLYQDATAATTITTNNNNNNKYLYSYKMCAYKDDTKDMEGGSDEPTEMTAMTGNSHSEAVAVSVPLTGMSPTVTTTTTPNGCSELYKQAWLKRQLGTPAGKCVLFFAFLGFTILISYLVTKIVMGIMYINECPLESFIPIYLLVSSLLLLIFVGLLLFLVIKYHGRQFSDDRVSPIHLVSLVYYFIHLVLQLAGSVCVIRTYSQVGDDGMESMATTIGVLSSEPSAMCNATLISFAFGVVVFELVLSGLCLLLTIVTIGEVIYFICFK